MGGIAESGNPAGYPSFAQAFSCLRHSGARQSLEPGISMWPTMVQDKREIPRCAMRI
jgi:hypothetical protein